MYLIYKLGKIDATEYGRSQNTNRSRISRFSIDKDLG